MRNFDIKFQDVLQFTMCWFESSNSFTFQVTWGRINKQFHVGNGESWGLDGTDVPKSGTTFLVGGFNPSEKY